MTSTYDELNDCGMQPNAACPVIARPVRRSSQNEDGRATSESLAFSKTVNIWILRSGLAQLLQQVTKLCALCFIQNSENTFCYGSVSCKHILDESTPFGR